MSRQDILNQFGKNLRVERVKNGLSQEKLAEKAGLSCFTHIGKIERGEMNPTLTTIVSIMKALNVSFEDFYKIY